MSSRRTLRLAYLVTHPIQYQAPLLRRISQEPDIDLTVYFGSDFSVRGYKDQGFGVEVKWDVPLLEGYKYEFLPRILDNVGSPGHLRPLNRGFLSRLSKQDVLWTHGYSSLNAIQAMLAAKALDVPVLLRAEPWLADRPRAGWKLAAKKVFFRALQNLVDATLPIGTLNSQYWTYYFGDDTPQFLFPYAVDNSYFQQRALPAREGRARLQQEFNLDPSRPVILFASKLQTRKHCDHLLEAYLRLAPAPGVDPHPYLVIVGDGEQRAQLEASVKQAGCTSVRFAGFRNQAELPGFFDLSSVFVLPSRHEPWGLIVNEVMNAGRAVVVSTDVGSQPDLVTDGVEGCVFPVGDIDALTDALRRVFATPETPAAMGHAALERINHWSFEEDVRGLRQALAHVTGNFIA
ncbi:glycosyltransferase family 4 protein [Terriglobus tenax]|uniref:glycosyltransferase family 4 protein n=1 Tax=Terriglobus tenax TaxID=1111115 RepID=UPI0021E00234|nr:glycosyltransferase family 4 protein [Terriglobus tenax]